MQYVKANKVRPSVLQWNIKCNANYEPCAFFYAICQAETNKSSPFVRRTTFTEKPMICVDLELLL